MGNILDAFAKEYRVDVTFSDFYALMKGCAERDILTNGINRNVPHGYMREMMTGKSDPEHEEENHEEKPS